MVAYRWLFGFWLFAATAAAQPNLSDPEQWGRDFAERVRAGKAPAQGAYLGNVLVVDSGDAPAPRFDRGTAQSLTGTPLRMIEESEWRVNVAVNRARTGRTAVDLLAISGADALLTVGSGVDLRILDRGEIKTLDGQAPGGKGSLAELLKATLGYDGIILEQRGNLVLVQTKSLAGARPGSVQGLILKDSADKYEVPASDDGGDGLLDLKAGGRDFSVFEIVLRRSKTPIAFATKVALQSGG